MESLPVEDPDSGRGPEQEDVDKAFGLQVEEPPSETPAAAQPVPRPEPLKAEAKAASPFDPPPAAVLASERAKPKPRAPAPEAEPTRPSAKAAVDDFLVGVGGGVMLGKGGRADPAVSLDFGWNLGSVLGWPGLFIKLDADLVLGQSPLGADYVMVDALGGFDGRFRLGPVRLSAGLGFGLRHMSITKQAASSFSEPEMGFGAGLRTGLEWPFWRFLSLAIDAEGRYTKDPLTGQFVFSGVITGGLRFVFQVR